MTGDRDRDPAGRPRNARPRDAAGRPLARGSAGGVVAPPEDLPLAPEDALRSADALLGQGRPFAAHEVLEAVWKSGPAVERDLWQGLAQLCVGLTHLQRGNYGGGVALLHRGADRLAGYRGPAYGVKVAGVVAAARALAERPPPPPGDGPPPLLRLVPPPG